MVYEIFSGNPIKGTLINRSLKGMGIKNIKWLNSDMTSTGKAARRKAYLEKIQKRFLI